MKLSRTMTYAIQATVELAHTHDSSPLSCSRIAARSGMPERFLLHILRNLVTHGLLRSTRGADGGYMLIRSPDDVTVLDVVEAVEGPLIVDILPLSKTANGLHDQLRNALEVITQTTRDELSAIKLSHLMPNVDE